MKNCSRLSICAGREQRYPQIAEADFQGAHQAQVAESLRAQRNRIIEELAQEVDARLAAAHQHDRFAVRGVRDLWLTVGRHLPRPPLHDALALGKETMTADIDAISFVLDRAGDASHERALFQHDRNDVSARKQLVGSGQPRRTGANNDGLTPLIHATISADFACLFYPDRPKTH